MKQQKQVTKEVQRVYAKSDRNYKMSRPCKILCLNASRETRKMLIAAEVFVEEYKRRQGKAKKEDAVAAE